MSDIASALKGEIIRLSKKVIRQHLSPLRSASITQRRQLAALRDQVNGLQKEIARLKRGAVQGRADKPADGEDTALRFVAKGFKTNRARLGLSAEETALILGVSGQSVFNWESGKSRPRAAQLPAIASLRKMGKREAAARLIELRPKSKGGKA